MKINMPRQVEFAIDSLENAGFQAYIVGGCVRDSLRMVDPKDWDICTSALPEETLEVFSQYKTIPTGLKHGTVTVVIEHMHLEITTFRVDGEYTDNRRPDNVKFTSSIEEDLARRDFTVNAMAFSPLRGLIDVFDGQGDLNNSLIRCVGNPDERFKEDALRIMRGLRFASVLGFQIDRETAVAMSNKRELLDNIAVERINVELSKFIVGENVDSLLMEYRGIFAQVMPEIKLCFDFNQQNFYHIYDVWEHIARSVEEAPKDDVIRIAMLLHDIGKPSTFSVGEEGIGHFYGHTKASERLARDVLNRLHFDNERKNAILMLVANHDVQLVAEKRPVKRMLNKFGTEGLERLFAVKLADASAQAPEFMNERAELVNKCRKIVTEIKEEELCFSLKDLAINGSDLIKNGYEAGPEIGRMLNDVLDAVIDEKVSNKKYDIMTFLDKSNKK